MGPGQKFLTWVSPVYYFVTRVRLGQPVRSATSGFGKFPLEIPNFSKSKKSHWVGPKNAWVKDRLASHLMRVKSMLGLGKVRGHL